jgi:hypothetical protein
MLTVTGSGLLSVFGLTSLRFSSTVRFWRRFICSCKFPHQCISAIVIEVHTGNVCIIQGTRTARTLVIVAATSAIEGTTNAASLGASPTMAGESRSLEVVLVALAMESLQKVGG